MRNEAIFCRNGEHFDFLKNKLDIAIYGNQTMMLLYKIDPARVAPAVTPILLLKMGQLFGATDRIVVY